MDHASLLDASARILFQLLQWIYFGAMSLAVLLAVVYVILNVKRVLQDFARKIHIIN